MTPDAIPPADELCALCDRLCDGSITAEERQRIETLVLSDPALRRLYVEQMHLHAQLHQQGARLSDAPLPAILSAVSPTEASPRILMPSPTTWRGTARLWNAAAALLLLSVGAWWLATRPDEHLAVLQEAQNARWGDSTLPTAPGSSLAVGRLHLLEGLARIRFKHGAEVTIEGPTELELVSAQTCRLQSGSVVAHVPPPAKGFTVLTSQVTLIDHGTDFGIRSDKDGRASVHVMQGEVELRHRNGGPALRLLTDQMAAVVQDGLQPLTSQDSEPGSPRTRSQAPIFTQELTSRSGRGAAAYVASPGTDRHFSDSLLMLKNANATTFLRKAYIRFDLAGIQQSDQLSEAQLTLYFEHTGYGFASLGGDARIGVYALIDDTQDGWTPEGLSWSTMPAFAADAGKVDGQRATKVGEFIMPAGVLRGPMTIAGSALLQRIREDGNRLLTLIVVRENPLEQASGIVHGFAGNRHPSLPPPTLRLR